MMNNIDDLTPNEAEEIKNPGEAQPVREESAPARGGIDQKAFQRQLEIDIEADENDFYTEEEVGVKSLDKQIDGPHING